MGKAVDNDGIPPVLYIELGKPTALEQFLGLLQAGRQIVAQADGLVLGGDKLISSDSVKIIFN